MNQKVIMTGLLSLIVGVSLIGWNPSLGKPAKNPLQCHNCTNGNSSTNYTCVHKDNKTTWGTTWCSANDTCGYIELRPTSDHPNATIVVSRYCYNRTNVACTDEGQVNQIDAAGVNITYTKKICTCSTPRCNEFGPDVHSELYSGSQDIKGQSHFIGWATLGGYLYMYGGQRF